MGYRFTGCAMIWSARLMVLRRKMELRVKDISSAMGKASQTRSRLPVRESSHAAGSSTTSCRTSSNSYSCSSRFNTIFFFKDSCKFINFFYCQVN